MENKYKCPWCGCEDMVYGVQGDRGKVKPVNGSLLDVQPIIHVVCKQCGTIVRSYVQHPEKLSE